MREIASSGRYIINKANKLITTMEGDKNKFVINTYLKKQKPMMWRKFFMNFANNRDYVKTFYYTPCKKIDRYCCEWCINNLMKRKYISANLIEIKREPPNQFSHMLPKYIAIWKW